MNITRILATSLSALALASLFAASSAHATPSCSVSSVSVTSVVNVNGGANLLAAPVASVECAGAYVGNDTPYPGTKSGSNLGYFGDGLVNGAIQNGKGNAGGTALLPEGMFAGQYGFQDLNKDGKADPGWLYLGMWKGSTFEGSTIGKGTTSAIDVASTTFSLTSRNGIGTWAITPNMANVNALINLLHGNALDQFALVFKAGNAFEAFDFTATALGLSVGSSTIYNFSGTFNLTSFSVTPADYRRWNCTSAIRSAVPTSPNRPASPSWASALPVSA